MRDTLMDADGQRRLGEYFDGIGDILSNKRRRASFAMYAMGLLADGERKSAEPIAARACGDPAKVDAVHTRLLHFVKDSVWSDQDVRLCAARYSIESICRREPIEAWIFDDTGFLKQGKHSVGVQRQYTGSAGKVTNCQIGVSLSLSSRSYHVPVDFDLYLPATWMSDPARRSKARIPEHLEFRTKIEMAMAMLERAVANELPPGVVLADSFYGDSSEFRAKVRSFNLDYAVGVERRTKVWCVDSLVRRRGDPLLIGELASQLDLAAYRRVTWRQGTKKDLSARFAFLRVVPFTDESSQPSTREDVWLVIEWEDGEREPKKFYFSSLPLSTSHKELVRILKQRWRTERVYQDLKDELGLDHFEGRTFCGWHHHVSVALACYAFVVAEQARHFPPSASWPLADDAQLVSA
jgi:SRSO17 transposase